MNKILPFTVTFLVLLVACGSPDNTAQEAQTADLPPMEIAQIADIIEPNQTDQKPDAAAVELLSAVEAVRAGDNQKVSQLIADGLVPNISFSNYTLPDDLAFSSLLCEAVKADKQDTVKLLLGKGASANSYCDETYNALSYAVMDKNYPIMQILVDAGADINGPNNNESLTPLLFAVRDNDIEGTEYLLSKGADVNLANGDITPLTEAAKNQNINIIKLLLKNKADVNGPAGYAPPLFYAVQEQNAESVKLFLSNGANPNLYATDGLFCTDKEACYTPLMKAAQQNDTQLMEILLQNGANKNIKNALGQTAYNIALLNGAAQAAAELGK